MSKKTAEPEFKTKYCKDFIHLIREKKKTGKIVIAEIGVGDGVTTLEAAQYLNEDDEYYLFDYTYELDVVVAKINELNYQFIAKKYGNSDKTFDSYVWNLAQLVLNMRKNNLKGIFDVVYLDGAHTLLHDGLASQLLKELVKKDGYIIFDDVYWTMGNSRTISRSKGLRDSYTEEQIATCHIDLILELFFRYDPNFKQIYFTANRKPYKATFQRIN